MIDIGDKVEIVDLKDYPDFGLRVGQTGDVVSIFEYEGHHVAQFAPDDQRGLKFNKDCKTYPLSLSRIAKVMALLIAMLMQSFAYAQPIIIGGTATDLEVLEARKLVRAADNAAGTLTVGSQFTTSEVDNARKLLQAIEPKKLEIKVGEFEAIEPAKSVTSPLLWVSMDDTIVERIAIPKGQPCAIWMTRRGDAAPKLHLFEAKPFDWAILVGKKNGASTIQIIRNGDDATKQPVIVDRIDVTAGSPKPTPTPQPKPDDPKPDDNRPTPIPLPGLRVLIVYESSELSKLPSEQVQMLTAKEVLDYLDAKCIKDPAGNPEYRKFDKDTDIKNMSEIWKQAMDRVLNGVGIQKEGKATELPWLLVSNGRTGYEGPLPKKVADLMAILKRNGGE